MYKLWYTRYDVPVGGLTCRITRGSFFVAALTASLSNADTEVDPLVDTVSADVDIPLPALRFMSGELLRLLRSRRVIDVGGTQCRVCCDGVRWTSRWSRSSELRASHGSGRVSPSDGRPDLRDFVTFSS